MKLPLTSGSMLEQAKEMHKKEIINAYEQAIETDVYNTPLKTGKQYYNETYGGNK